MAAFKLPTAQHAPGCEAGKRVWVALRTCAGPVSLWERLACGLAVYSLHSPCAPLLPVWGVDRARHTVPPPPGLSEERDGVLSILASSSKPEGTSVSSSGLDMSVRSKSGRPAGTYEMRL